MLHPKNFPLPNIFDRKNCNLPYLSLGLHKGCPNNRSGLQPSKENIQHFKTWNFFTFPYFCGSFLPSWIRIQRLKLMRINAEPDPKILFSDIVHYSISVKQGHVDLPSCGDLRAEGSTGSATLLSAVSISAESASAVTISAVSFSAVSFGAVWYSAESAAAEWVKRPDFTVSILSRLAEGIKLKHKAYPY